VPQELPHGRVGGGPGAASGGGSSRHGLDGRLLGPGTLRSRPTAHDVGGADGATAGPAGTRVEPAGRESARPRAASPGCSRRAARASRPEPVAQAPADEGFADESAAEEEIGASIRSLDYVAPPKAKREQERKADAPRARRRARLRLINGRELVLELTVEGERFDWDAPATAQVRLDDGRLVAARLDSVRSTRAGSYPVGQTLRIVLTLADEPGAATPTLASFATLDLEVHPA
jgi:hypothetical protein